MYTYEHYGKKFLLRNILGAVLGRIPQKINYVINLFFNNLVNQLILIQNRKKLLKINLLFSF